MKFSVNWLREFVDLPPKVEDLTELLTLSGVEIEGIEERGANFDKVVVAQINASAQHPNADRLSVCQVDDGSGQTRQIVCGATNYKVGDKVPLALPGAELSKGLKIKESKLRGVESQGMLCSAIELGLGQDAAGLLILSPEAKIGAPIGELFPADTILDVEITPNRGDLLSHFGLAREIAALTEKRVKMPAFERRLEITAEGIEITALRECPFYTVRKIDHVKVGPSPDWLRAKIEAAGIRSINNIVDISNFVMLELGQPTHAFDADKLKGEIKVRLASDGEKFLALDGKTYSLTSKDLVIADQERVVGIGGVMGGEETGVTESTQNILLEAAYFLPASVRRTARTLNLPSDASYRFERGVDPGMVEIASSRASLLMRDIAGGKPAQKLAEAGKLPPNPDDISLRYEKCDQVLGLPIKPKVVDQILERFGLSKSKNEDKKRSIWKIPSYRRDLQRDVDLIEEVVRSHGVQGIAGTDRSRFTPASSADLSHDVESALRERLVGRGLTEARTSKLIPRKAGPFRENAVELRNPLSEDHVALRPSLLSGLLNVLGRNVRAGAEQIAVFEIGRVFIPPNGGESRRLGILFWGKAVSAAHWRSPTQRSLDFIDLKGAIESITLPKSLSFRRTEHPDLVLATEIHLDDQVIGMAGQLSAPHAATVDASGAVVLAELNVDFIVGEQSAPRVFREMDRFPEMTRDIAMIVPEAITHEQVVRIIQTPPEPLLESVQLFDLFSGNDTNNVGAARKSLAYRLTYRDRNRTLTADQVTAAHAKIRERLRHEVGAELRE
jgi:phenylalanyl-tRNA synthetase beta chain